MVLFGRDYRSLFFLGLLLLSTPLAVGGQQGNLDSPHLGASPSYDSYEGAQWIATLLDNKFSYCPSVSKSHNNIIIVII